MGIAVNAATNFARRLVEKYTLKPPINIKSLVKKYAELVFADVPFEGVDGISVNLKVRGKTTRVIVNENLPQTRQRFTMAHELGHVIIPWHVGTIIDRADPVQHKISNPYWKIEDEANVFAAELLMPFDFVRWVLSKNSNLACTNKLISRDCEVSVIASAIRLAKFVPENVVYAYEKNGVVEFSGRSDGTIASGLSWGGPFPTNPFDYSEDHFISQYNAGTIHWWILPGEIHLKVNDKRSWREILDGIVHDIGVSSSKVEKFKASVNGVIAYANGACKSRKVYNVDSVVSACIQRFKDNEDHKELVHHQDFNSFLVKKAEDLVEKVILTRL